MYRDYENPRVLEKRLEELKAEIDNPELDDEERYYLYCDIEDLRQRINFAWQDEYEDDF